MAIFHPITTPLRDGAVVELFSPAEEDAQALLDYLDLVRRETSFIMYGPQDTLPELDAERKWVRNHLDHARGLNLAVRVVKAGGGGDEPYVGQIVALAGLMGGHFRRVQHKAELGISARRHWSDRGLGTTMMQHLIDWATAHPDIEVLTLSVFAHNPRAIRLYEKCGFERHGVRPREVRYEDGTYADVLYMSRWVGSHAAPASAAASTMQAEV